MNIPKMMRLDVSLMQFSFIGIGFIFRQRIKSLRMLDIVLTIDYDLKMA
jgi:hypothetical protein